MLTVTTTKLIEDLRDPANAEAWGAFDGRYRPILIGFAVRLGFAHADAEELAQRALVEFARAYREGRYERGRGRLSSWLIGIARNTGMAMRRSIAEGGRLGGGTRLEEMPGEGELTRVWAREREQAILGEALAQLRASERLEAHTFRAFELFALRGVPASEVAEQCGIAVDSVYVIKNRLTRRLREIVRELTTAYEEEG